MSDSALRAVGESSKWLDELRVLYADATEPSLIALCARLRDIDRADLGREAATRALDLEARGQPSPRTRAAALTTRAAALLDLGDPPRALTDIRKAAELRPDDPYVLNAYARVLTACGQPDQAVDVAKESFRLDPGRHAVHALLAAAAAARDESTLAEAKDYLSAHPDPEEKEATSVWVEVLAAEALIAAGQIERAASAVAMLRRDGRAPQGKVNA